MIYKSVFDKLLKLILKLRSLSDVHIIVFNVLVYNYKYFVVIKYIIYQQKANNIYNYTHKNLKLLERNHRENNDQTLNLHNLRCIN